VRWPVVCPAGVNLGKLVALGASMARNSTYENPKKLRAQTLVTTHPEIFVARGASTARNTAPSYRGRSLTTAYSS
jgi:hypothetical protein